MLNIIINFAESGPAVHITPTVVTQINGINITNSMLYAWISSVIILALLITVRKMMTLKPRRGVIQLVEVGTEFVTKLISSSMGSHKKALKYAPFFTALFFYIMLSNWLGLLPVVGEGFTSHGAPLFKPATADLNGTLAAAIVAMVLVQYFAIRESGFIKHLGHYFNGSFKNPMTIFLGLFEILGEFIRVFSLALRLFLNVAIGEIIIAVFAYLGHFAAPITALPFTILEMLVGALQAYIFVMLSVMYLSVAISHGHEHEVEDNAMNAETSAAGH